MPKSRIMGAGLASSTTRNVSTNGCQGGGNKKQGTAFLTGRMDSVWPISSSGGGAATRGRATGTKRHFVFCVNQLGGVGRFRSQYTEGADGVARCKEGRYNNKCRKVGDSVVIQTKYQPPVIRSKNVKNYHFRAQHFQ
jgi:hypothetical protein